MDSDNLEEAIRNKIVNSGLRSSPNHHFHPSQISGCSLKLFLNKVTDHETTLNSWLFQGSAVHHYLQEYDEHNETTYSILTEAIKNAGYNPALVEYEKNIKYPITEDVWINGTCDILIHDNDEKIILDIKYSSIPVESGHGRLYKYYAQANTYAHMFNADEYALLMINSKSQKLKRDIHILDGELSEESWEIVKQKALNVKQALVRIGFEDGTRFTNQELNAMDVEFWEEIMQDFNTDNIPSYKKECQYCDHKSYCPVKNGKLGGGVNELIEKGK